MTRKIRYAAQVESAVPSERRAPLKSWAKAIWADFATDPDVVAAVLPRPLEPSSEPRVHVNVCSVEMESGAKFGAANFTVRARHGNVEGEYSLALPMTTEQAVVGGRETWGEPKKIAAIDVTRTGSYARATVTRQGVTYIELVGKVLEKLPTPPPRQTLDFYFKYLINPDGKGFDSDPALVYCRRTYEIRSFERMEGEIVLRDSPFDPVADIPIRKLLSFHFLEYHSDQVGEIVDRVPGEWIAPFVHQRYDGFSWKR
jgi:acetoacetate decarboxylase